LSWSIDSAVITPVNAGDFELPGPRALTAWRETRCDLVQRFDTLRPTPMPAPAARETSHRPAPRGWCPGALRPMLTGDGLLVRLRLTGGIVELPTARAIAACASRFGNGQIDLSSRANLQLRGVGEATLPGLTAELERLNVLDASAEAETVRNVTASPLAGLDPTAVLDIRPLAKALEARLTGDTTLHRLPGKFGFLIDDGGALPLAGVSADIRFTAIATPQGPRFLIALGGAESAPINTCALAELVDRAARLAQAFIDLRGQTPARRMRDLVRSLGVAAIAEAAGVAMHDAPAPADRHVAISHVIGRHEISGMTYLGVALPFGRMDSAALEHLATVASRHGATGLRLTPWRVILVVGLSADAADAMRAEMHTHGFILAADDARLHVAACPGAPSCNSGTTPVQPDATRFSRLFTDLAPSGTVLHVSGCAKGCAHASSARFTLVGNAGRYELIENGTAGDAPVAVDLSPDEVEAELSRRLRAPKERPLVQLP
jgi:precorrin-3B synthase